MEGFESKKLAILRIYQILKETVTLITRLRRRKLPNALKTNTGFC